MSVPLSVVSSGAALSSRRQASGPLLLLIRCSRRGSRVARSRSPNRTDLLLRAAELATRLDTPLAGRHTHRNTHTDTDSTTHREDAMHARFLVLFLALVCAACGPLTFASGSSPSPSSPPVAAAASFVHQLTDDNFEHETQASTGSTTGDWFVEFYAPWCGHCQSLAPVWNELASWCRDEKVPVTIAMLDATSSVRTAKRLDIRSFPSLKLISRGVVYDYHGPRTLQALQQFVENRAWLAEGVTSRPMPAEMGAGDYLRDASKQVWNDLLLLSQRKPAAAITLVVTGLVIGVIVSMIVYILFIESAPVVHRLATQPTGAAALETTPAGAGEAARARTDRQTRTSARSQTQSTKKDE